MALIKTFELGEKKRHSRHEEVAATYHLHEIDGGKLFQINTLGREGRDLPGSTSQSIQLDEDSARELVRMLQQHFGFR